jgi:hypothetical protein
MKTPNALPGRALDAKRLLRRRGGLAHRDHRDEEAAFLAPLELPSGRHTASE